MMIRPCRISQREDREGDIMVRAALTDNGSEIFADCYAEDTQHFTMMIDKSTFEIKDSTREEDSYTAHVIWKIMSKYRKTGIIPKKIFSVWM